MIDGTCGCRLCGLRGHSKNVQSRSVFPSFRGRPLLLETYEACMKAREDKDEPGTYLFGSNSRNWAKDDAPLYTLADNLINYLQTPDASIEDLRILLCVHDWVQDEGTASV